MKKTSPFSRILSCLLALTLLLSLCPAALAAEEERTLSIGTLEEWIDFAQRCASDEFSHNLNVLLTADIDAGGVDVSVPIFLGSLDGQGHRITGLRLTSSASGYGLFSRLESGAVIKNLAVEGEVSPSGSQGEVGGIVGTNSGRIENCRFSGVVFGHHNVGGIAGLNSASGILVGCSASGMVRGTQYTGGIAGKNEGSLLRCANTAAVNTTLSEAEAGSADLQNLESTLYSLLKREEVTENAVTSDTGGIAGYSTGAIQSCVNSGSVGYPHVGYNVGGIAGRQNGYLASGVNFGVVQGRKDVGGIVGQMAPDITVQWTESGLDELQSELNSLQTLINRTLDDAQSASDRVSNRLVRISDYTDSARDHAHSLAGGVGDFVDENISATNDLLLLVERYLSKAAPILEELSAVSDSVTDSIAELRGILAHLDGDVSYDERALTHLADFCTEMDAYCHAAASALDALDEALALLAGPSGPPDTQPLRGEISALQDALAALRATVDRAQEELADSGTTAPETGAQIRAELLAVLDGHREVSRGLADALRGIDLGALRDQDKETLLQTLAALQSALQSLRAAASHGGDAMGALLQTMRALAAINAPLQEIFAQLDAAANAAQQAAAAFARVLDQAAQWAAGLSSEGFDGFSPLGPQVSESGSALNASLSGISSELNALNGEVSSSNAALLGDLRAVNNQFMKVMNLFINLLNNTQNIDYTDVFEDVSEESLQSATRGKVLECRNEGAVSADRNVGGIAGAMAIEHDLDPEDDLLSSEQRTLRFTYQTKAILLDCDNYGSVQAKKSCAGGVTGRMDLGTVSGCGGWGSVASESGDYVGGVAGLSLSSIRDSYAKCALSGDKYVGGIAGSGSRVSGCIAMPGIEDCSQLCGAIAGEITGDCAGNVFVSDALAGVDRVSLSGQAERLRYDELLRLKNLPEDFRRLNLRFVSEDQTIKKLSFDYGDSFADDVYPKLPEKEGFYVRWEGPELTRLCFDTVVTAVYEPYVTTLATEDAPNAPAALLVEGCFRTEDRLQASAEPLPASAPAGALEAWTLQIPDDGQASRTVRWRIPEGGNSSAYAVYLQAESGWLRVPSEAVGSYLCFELSGSDRFVVAASAPGAWWVWALAAAAGIALLGGALLLRRRRRAKAAP